MRGRITTILGLLVSAAVLADEPWINEPPEPGGFVPGDEIITKTVNESFTVQVSSREQVRLFHTAVHAASDGVAHAWAGNVAAGNAGDTSAAFKDAVIRRVNYFRALAGIPAGIAWTAEYSRKAQRAALMMSANRQLDHNPGANWIHYSADGAEAARNSNLYLGRFGPQSIDGYILDPGPGNAPVGHRRWIFHAQTRLMGTGDIPATDYPSANALWVFDSNMWAARPPTREAFLQWPPPGFFPYTLVPGRWSFSLPGANFASAQVRMTRAGQNLPVRMEPASQGFSDNAIVWVPSGLNTDLYDHPRPESDLNYTVIISGVVTGGQSRSFTNTVWVFDPATAGPDTVDPRPQGPVQLAVGAPARFAIPAVPAATSYRWQWSRVQAFDRVITGADASEPVTWDTAPGYAVRVSETAATGTNCYRLAHPQPTTQTLSISESLLVHTNTVLRFDWFLGLATASQIARVQVLVDGSWREVWSRAGTSSGFTPPFVFQRAEVPLGNLAGRTIQIRFRYEASGTYFPQTTRGAGFYVDDISVANSSRFVETVPADVAANGFDFTPPGEGSYLLQAGARVFGPYFAGWGSALEVQAVAGPRELRWTRPVLTPEGTVRLGFQASGLVGAGFELESSTRPLDPASWTPVSDAVGIDGNEGAGSFVVPVDAPARFFRVRTRTLVAPVSGRD
jgi:uncharacterized protein YkwD